MNEQQKKDAHYYQPFHYSYKLPDTKDLKPGVYLFTGKVTGKVPGVSPDSKDALPLKEACQVKLKTMAIQSDKNHFSFQPSLFDTYETNVSVAQSENGTDFHVPLYISPYKKVQQALLLLFPNMYPHGCTSAQFEISDLKLNRLSGHLGNVIIDENVSIQLTSEDGKVIYEEGKDYRVTDENGKPVNYSNVKDRYPNTFKKLHNPLSNQAFKVKIEWLGKGNTKTKPQKVRANYSIILGRDDFHTHGHTQPCMWCDDAYEKFEDIIIKPYSEMVGNDVTGEVYLTFDEIRAFGRDSRNFRDGKKIENWKTFLHSFEKQFDLSEKYFPDKKVMVSTMLTMAHNGGDPCYLWWDYNSEWQENCGETALGMADIVKKYGRNVYFNPWGYPDNDNGWEGNYFVKSINDLVGLFKSLSEKYGKENVHFIPMVSPGQLNIEGWLSVFEQMDFYPDGIYGYQFATDWPKFTTYEETFNNRLNNMEHVGQYTWNGGKGAPIGNKWEVCNGLDDDGDGKIDEQFKLEDDVFNCGECGNVCYSETGVVPVCTFDKNAGRSFCQGQNKQGQ